MAFIEGLRPAFVRRIIWPVAWFSLTGNAKGYRTYVPYSNRASKGILARQEFGQGFLFSWVEIELAVILFFPGLSTAGTILKGSAADIVVQCLLT